MIVLAFLPAASILSDMPRAALAGLVIASVLPLVRLRPFIDLSRFSRPQFFVAVITFGATLASAPRVERGVLIGVGLSLAVHLWRELDVESEAWTADGVLHVRPQGVLYFGSAPVLVARMEDLVAADPSLSAVLLHLERLGRLDVTGALALRSLIDDLASSGVRLVLTDPQPQARRILRAVCGQASLDGAGDAPTSSQRASTDGRGAGSSPGSGDWWQHPRSSSGGGDA